jgi:DNA mismatch repair protein MutL
MEIKILDTRVIAQIAAGEVVERPSSITKELVENALDAGSSQITVEIKGGGISFIRVTDNGCGIPAKEAELAFERHATSKIGDVQDLQHLTTLGFRGEALPSIAAVAQVQFLTCARSETAGTYLSLDNGKVVQHELQARSAGTTVTVQNLFRRIPARLKFLKSQSTETGHIAELVSQYALAYPEIKFSLLVDGKTTLRTPGSGKLSDCVTAVYGVEVSQNMLEVQQQDVTTGDERTSVAVSGLVSTPRISRSTRDYISFFVNRRWINNRMLNFAVEEAYHGLLMQGKHPIAVINMALPPELIDVNVHPAKTEIKFQDERAVFSAVQKSVRQVLVRSSPVPQIEENTAHFNIPQTPFSIPRMPAGVVKPAAEVTKPDSSAPTPMISLPLLRVLGQLSSTYIVAEGPEALFLIDQHAAHERILFEKLNQQLMTRKIEVQGLLKPEPFEVEPRQIGLLKTHLKDLVDFGFDIELFGERTFLVRSLPALLKERDWAGLLRELLENPAVNWSENLAISLACHSAIRAGQILNDAEMRELIVQLEQTALPHSCPHGRPTLVQMTIKQLEKEFGRIG